ncbi:DUF6973 domain-containing protein [Paenibacillus sp. SYP-B4298]|uniref:DUF6973 domain-containing protein n=1 Tax=Paenibacillus sp. SYP-B4298 TaxID=2996034 RepID=UPI0022DD20AD|nr:hypothetical protein [Paenibacillus sp. SYP-B4298]
MRKFLLVFTIIFAFSGLNLSFAANDSFQFAETEEELVAVEKQLNSIVIEVVRDELMSISEADTDKEKNNSLNNNFTMEISQKELAEKEKELKNISSYEDVGIEASFDEVKSQLIEQGFILNSEFVELLESVNQYKSTNPDHTTKEIVKHFNLQSGLVEENNESNYFQFSFGSLAFALSYSDWTSLTTAEKLLVASNPASALVTNSLSKRAFELTEEKFGYNGLGDKSDAYRHGVWNALMTLHISRAWASLYATAHENKSQDFLNGKAADGYYEWQHRDMDLHNNQIGRDVITWYDTWPFVGESIVTGRINARLTNNSSDLIWLHS